MNFRIAAADIGADNRSWVQLHVSTGGVATKGEQKFEVTPADIAIYAAYIKANPDRIPIDYDHSFDKNGSSKAAGWVDASTAEVRNGDELWAQIDWTPAAAEAIKAGEYRYISPEFTFQKIVAGVLRGAAKFIAATLTNRPFLKTMAPVRLDDDSKPSEGGNMKDIALSLGLAEDADESTITAAIKKRHDDAKVIADKVTAAETAAAEYKTALDAATKELDTLKATASDGDKKVAKLTEQVAALAKEAHESKRTALLDDAIKGDEPKMLPAERDAMVALYDAAGHDAVVALLEARPAIKLNTGRGSGGDAPGSGEAGDVGGTPIDPVTADLDAQVQAHLRSLKLDHEPTQDDYLRAVEHIQATA